MQFSEAGERLIVFFGKVVVGTEHANRTANVSFRQLGFRRSPAAVRGERATSGKLRGVGEQSGRESFRRFKAAEVCFDGVGARAVMGVFAGVGVGEDEGRKG
jgi:hypothetical protein